MKLSIIIIHWNTPGLLEQLLQLMKVVTGAEVIVIDNASTASWKHLMKEFPSVSFISNKLNRGFSGACNQGAQEAIGEWLLFLNPDTHISNEQIQQMLSDVAKQNLDAAVANLGSIKYQKPIPSFWSLCVEFSPLHRFIPLSIFSKKTLPGGCLLIKKSTLTQVSGWDERFFVWFEDSDLSKKLLLSPVKFATLEDVIVDHEGGVSFDRMDQNQKKQFFFTSMNIYAEKYFSFMERWVLGKIMRRYIQTKLLPFDPQIEVSLVIPNVKSEILETFLETNLSFFDFTKQELIVVTSAPNISALQQKYSSVIFIQLNENHGFADTVNIGLRRARGKVIGTVNDDTILNSHWLEILLNAFDEKTGSISPVIYNRNGEIESAGITVLPQGKADPITIIDADHSSDAFNGAAVLFNRDALNQVGLFDQKFGSYLEDVDLGLRLKKNGWQNRVIQKAQITHLAHQTARARKTFKAWLDVKNWWLVILKNWNKKTWLQFGPSILLERIKNLSGLVKIATAPKST